MVKVLTQDEALRIASNIARASNKNARDLSKTPSKPANELEGLIRDKLPDPVRRHLIDVIIDRTDADGLAANWTAQPVWSHEVSNNDKGEFIRAMFEVLGTMTCGPTISTTLPDALPQRPARFPWLRCPPHSEKHRQVANVACKERLKSYVPLHGSEGTSAFGESKTGWQKVNTLHYRGAWGQSVVVGLLNGKFKATYDKPPG